jgi:predicted NUDIX family NTP pyrophosphohydrolase
LLGYRHGERGLEFLIVHPGGPFWARKDEGAWSIPKGLCEPDEEELAVAQREYREETGFEPSGPYTWLGALRQPSGKTVSAWAFPTDVDVSHATSNTFEMEYPPRSGRTATFPEVDRWGWFTAEEARVKLLRGQVGFIDAAIRALEDSGETATRSR